MIMHRSSHLTYLILLVDFIFMATRAACLFLNDFNNCMDLLRTVRQAAWKFPRRSTF